MKAFIEDLQFALRTYWKNPGFTAVAVLTLCLGVAAVTTVFGWIDTVMLRPVPGLGSGGELTVLEAVTPEGGRMGAFPHPDFRDFQREMRLASGVVAAHIVTFNIGPVESPRRVLGQVVSANHFAVLGIQPYLGRMFTQQEDLDSPGASPVAVISHRLWQTYFRGDPKIVGRAVRINGRQLTIVGVTPPAFRGVYGGAALDAWVPLSMILQMGGLNTWAAADRNARFLDVTVRLKPGVTIEQARAEAQSVAVRIAEAHPDTHRRIGATLVPMWQASYGLQSVLRTPLRILMVVAGLVLLIACANVANLLVTRSLARRRELGLRMALGAGRWRLVRQLLAEALVLAGAGAVAGLLLAQYLGESLYYLFPGLDPQLRAAVDPLLHAQAGGLVMLFTVLISTGSAMVAVILPAVAVSRTDLNETLKEGGRGGTSGTRTHRLRGAIVAAEVALASMALVSAAAAVRSFQKLTAVDPGFNERNVLVAHMHLSTNAYTLEREKQFSRDLRLRLESVPGIESVSYAESVPLSIYGPSSERVQLAGKAEDREGVITVRRSVVAPGYFSLMGIPLVSGRDFTEQDDRGKPRVIVVNETFAKKFFEGKDPVGRMVRVSGSWSTIVGMVKDSKYRTLSEAPMPFFYGPFRQIFFSGQNHFFYVRTAGPAATALRALKREAAALDPNSGLYDVAPLSDHAKMGLFAERAAASLLSALGILSLALASVGLYSLMSYTVNERRDEIGIRMALGARPAGVLGLILGKGLTLTFTGLFAGVMMTMAVTRILSSSLNVQIGTGGPDAVVAGSAFLILVTLVASYIPARRATKIDPARALRSE